MANIHSQSIPQTVLDEIKTKLNEAIELMKPYAITIGAAERSELAKLGDKTLAFVEKTKTHSADNPLLRPAYFDYDEFSIDFSDYQNLRPLSKLIEQLLNYTDDTMMVSGSEAYIAALSFYNSVKDASKRDIPGAKAVYDDLKARFPQNRKKAE
ncbi:MAG: hypothetical protein PHS59_05795 [Paludibacter sp.]|nr:hypothetical protein [Paludibacter sp.]